MHGQMYAHAAPAPDASASPNAVKIIAALI
jgi:hypothetical protein